MSICLFWWRNRRKRRSARYARRSRMVRFSPQEGMRHLPILSRVLRRSTHCRRLLWRPHSLPPRVHPSRPHPQCLPLRAPHLPHRLPRRHRIRPLLFPCTMPCGRPPSPFMPRAGRRELRGLPPVGLRPPAHPAPPQRRQCARRPVPTRRVSLPQRLRYAARLPETRTTRPPFLRRKGRQRRRIQDSYAAFIRARGCHFIHKAAIEQTWYTHCVYFSLPYGRSTACGLSKFAYRAD